MQDYCPHRQRCPMAYLTCRKNVLIFSRPNLHLSRLNHHNVGRNWAKGLSDDFPEMGGVLHWQECGTHFFWAPSSICVCLFSSPVVSSTPSTISFSQQSGSLAGSATDFYGQYWSVAGLNEEISLCPFTLNALPRSDLL